MSMASLLVLSKLELSLHLGWLDEERLQKQVVFIDISIRFAKSPLACSTDQLSDTYCYAALVEVIKKQTENRSFRLVEYLAQEIYQIIKNQVGQNNAILIAITKQPAIANLTGGIRFQYGDEGVSHGDIRSGF